jgi:hypothetical protein
MKVGIMQPYFMPYIGYFQLLNLVDKFIIYDNIQYTKKGWVNRNRILLNGEISSISIPLRKDSDYLNINERYLAENWEREKIKLINKIRQAYIKAPNFNNFFPVLEKIINHQNENLFEFIYNSIICLNDFLGIDTEIIISSTIKINHELKSEEKVLAICKFVNAKQYINPIGGFKLYDKNQFKKESIYLSFLKTDNIIYNQFQNNFIPFLSIIDIIMFNSKDEIMSFLVKYKLN